MSELALSIEERDAVMDLMISSIKPLGALEVFEDADERRRFHDYVLLADDLGFDQEPRDEYPIGQPGVLRRVLTEWQAAAEGWLRSESTESHDYRLDIWATCSRLLDRMAPE